MTQIFHTVNQVMVATVKLCDDFNFTKRNPWPSHGGDRKSSLLTATFYQGNPDRNHKLWNIVSIDMYTPYASAAGMLLHINGKFTMGKLKSSLLS